MASSRWRLNSLSATTGLATGSSAPRQALACDLACRECRSRSGLLGTTSARHAEADPSVGGAEQHRAEGGVDHVVAQAFLHRARAA